MNVYIIGGNGWIGNKMTKLFEANNIPFVCSKYRAENKEIYQDILNSGPSPVTHVFCCSGRTHGTINNTTYTTIDYLENPETTYENINDNLYVPVSLSLFCDKNNLHFTYIGTGCIFNYDDEHTIDNLVGFTEEDEPNFFGSNYSIVKGVTDKLMKNTNGLTLRIRMPISSDSNGRNFITKITKYEHICSIKNSMTVLDDMLPLCISMMKNKESGIYNFTNPGSISHNEILELYRDIIDPTFTWKNFDITEQNKILKSKRSNNYLDTRKLEAKYNVISIRDAVINALNIMKSEEVLRLSS
jgi:dTDP-4-dehydrorhamnose reductase